MRGQAHALEAVIGSLLLLTGVLVAMQISVVTPLSASTSSQFIENQQQAEAHGVLANAAETGWLKKSVVYWNETESSYFDDEGADGYSSEDPIPADNAFGQRLSETFLDEGIAYNVYFVYEGGSELKQRPFIYRGVPSDKSVTATRTVTIMTTDRLVAEDGSPQATTVEGSSSFYMTDADASSPVYKVVTVKVIAWRN